MVWYIFACIISMGFTYVATIFAIKISKKWAFVDVPKRRNIHKQPVPILGGLAILVGTLVNMWQIPLNPTIITIICCAIAIFLIGLVDDKLSLKPAIKVALQTMVISVLFINGIKVDFITFPVAISPLFFTPIVSFIITQIWFIVVINMFNLIDGVDGLASGISLITACILFVVSLAVSPPFISLLLVSIIGATGSFLRFNFYPAKIFLGDSGSLLLGYLFAVISVVGVMKSTMSFILLGFVFALPLMDLCLSIFRRLIKRKNIFKPDLMHIHHQLVRRGMSTPKAVFTLYLISGMFGGLAIFIAESQFVITPYILASCMLIAVFIYFNYLQLSTKRFKTKRSK